MQDVRIRTALVSVSDKRDLDLLAAGLKQFDVDVLSTGGTFRALSESGVNVSEVSGYTGFPEMMDGRVKTLHPKVHGGLLGRLDDGVDGVDRSVMEAHGIQPIDLVVVNLYPFQRTVASPDVTFADAIENIDIGGPAMLRSAAKNLARVAVVVDPDDYGRVIQELEASGGTLSGATRFLLARKAFDHVAVYDVAISEYLASVQLDK